MTLEVTPLSNPDGLVVMDLHQTIESANGSVTIALPPDASAEISADTVHGGISSDFPLQSKKNFPIGQDLHGRLGDGGPTIKMSTVNGGIRLDRAKTVALDNR